MALEPVIRNFGRRLAAEDARGFGDRELLGRFLADRDEVAFAAIVERHGAMVRGVCHRVLGHEQDCEDACQAVFLVLARRAAAVRKHDSLASWLHGVAIRVARKALARRSRQPVHTPDTADVAVPDATAEVTWRDAKRLVDAAVARLPERFRLPVVLCYLEGLTRDEAAAQLGWTTATLRGRLERGRDRLRADLARRGFPLSAAFLAVAFTNPSTASAASWAATLATTILGPAGPSPAASALAYGAIPSMKKKLVIVLIAFAGVLASGVVALKALAPPLPPGTPTKAVRVYDPDPASPPTPDELKGVWVNEQIYPDGTGKKTWTLRFPDGQHSVLELDGVSPGVKYVMTRRQTYRFPKPDEMETTVTERYHFDDPLKLRPAETKPQTSSFKWDNKERTSFTLTYKPERAEDASTSLTYRKTEPPAVKPDPLVPEYLTKIDRTIRKQPVYETKTPGYLLLAFGPEAKHKIWVVIDGNKLYIDRNGNGDLTEPGEKIDNTVGVGELFSSLVTGNKPEDTKTAFIFVAGGIAAPGGTSYGDLTISGAIEAEGRILAMMRVGGKPAQKTGIGYTWFRDTPADAKVFHFASPVVTLQPSMSAPFALDANEPANPDRKFYVELGTPGIGFGTFATIEGKSFPKDVNPVADFEFPAAEAGKPPIKFQKTLSYRQMTAFGVVDQFGADVTIPEGAGRGKGPAKVTLSFPNCPVGKIEPRTFEVYYRVKVTNEKPK
ncbi:RNA polymerase sigma factor [Fimbriiglobus ruber]|uniref:High-affnity carbon uptake protein Hat/HatR n=1 Tax=Fimbriiglobus ruber TaxID=1908690 RepID=A0A225DZ42_9BACT|nr:RNA polymerase sigma factor [Fimbriiglobus ruber]OWK43798.1 High-affnity carbon uptake protein Hat/HatR [Fimbriiglobus ruber]